VRKLKPDGLYHDFDAGQLPVHHAPENDSNGQRDFAHSSRKRRRISKVSLFNQSVPGDQFQWQGRGNLTLKFLSLE